MDFDIQFGELEQAAPAVQLRPDRNRHFAVVPYGSPRKNDLPVFVDMDVIRDMEAHALSDASVELGGVMLGGQHEDNEGRPFVVITDSLRATHYENTKGSFKFTHDTWTEISRRREEYPADLQMVGWYHTHPGWGVFLSEMDLFICENFFNKLLDVALVIDPHRGDRGMFQRSQEAAQRVRRIGGFYLTASRYRQHELELYAAQLEGKLIMTVDPRTGALSAPIVNISEPRSSWQGIATLGMLTAQFFLLVLIAWRLLSPTAASTQHVDDRDAQIAVLQGRVEQLVEAERLKAQADLLDRVLQQLKDAPPGAVPLLMEQTQRNEDLTTEIRGLRALERELSRQNAESDRSLAAAEAEQSRLARELKDLQAANRELAQLSDSRADEIARLEGEVSELEEEYDAGEGGVGGWRSPWTVVFMAALAAVAAAAVGAAVWLWRKAGRRDGPEPNENGRQETNT